MEPELFDLVVIGAGPAGEKAANAAAAFGKRVAIVEKSQHVGGAVANTGDTSSKTLRETALALSGIKARKLYGVDLSLRREATIADFMHHEHRALGERDAPASLSTSELWISNSITALPPSLTLTRFAS